MNKEFQDELMDCPLLMNLKSKNPFKVPETYFENLEYPFSTDMQFDKVPSGYFEELPSKVIDQLDLNPRKSKTKFLWPIISSIAASIALLLYFQPSEMESVSPDDTWAYVLDNYESYEMEELLDLFEEEDLLSDDLEIEEEYIINQFIDEMDDDELESLL